MLIFRYGQRDTSLPPGLACALGAFAVEDFSAFGVIATKLAGSHHAYCPDGSVDVATPGSIEGLNRLRDAPTDRRLGRLALSDGIAGHQDYPGLVARWLAVVRYSLVANPKVPVSALTFEQARRISPARSAPGARLPANPTPLRSGSSAARRSPAAAARWRSTSSVRRPRTAASWTPRRTRAARAARARR
ncbi:hypothetical protein [Dactylosporangium sp. CA-139066]|uniref:hypothetical protein n=1 Tax=Dactylosporangium sp. CA-139066 TaxID=3239930 RepID=UPI003D8E7144